MASLSRDPLYLPKLQNVALTLGNASSWASELEPGKFESALKRFMEARFHTPIILEAFFRCSSEFAIWLRECVHVLEIRFPA